jgi:hypothetical protein
VHAAAVRTEIRRLATLHRVQTNFSPNSNNRGSLDGWFDAITPFDVPCDAVSAAQLRRR